METLYFGEYGKYDHSVMTLDGDLDTHWFIVMI